MADDNSRGFHKPHQVNMERGGSGQGGEAAPHGGGKSAREPTNHAGHTHEMSRRHEHDARVESMRGAHAGAGQGDHQKILHDTHKLHQGTFTSHGSKHGANHHLRGDGE